MITIKQFMEVANYKIREGSDYQWTSYGPNAYVLDASLSDELDDNMCSIVFDTKNQTVYEVQTHDYIRNRAYRMINPVYKLAHGAECMSRNITDEAWENVKFTDLDMDEDFIEKTKSILEGQEYDTRVQIEITLSDDEVIEYMKMAHKLDITFNELINRSLQSAIDASINHD